MQYKARLTCNYQVTTQEIATDANPRRVKEELTAAKRADPRAATDGTKWTLILNHSAIGRRPKIIAFFPCSLSSFLNTCNHSYSAYQSPYASGIQNQKKKRVNQSEGYEHKERKREISKFDSYGEYTVTKGSNRATGLE